LPQVKGLGDIADSEFDALAQRATDAYDELDISKGTKLENRVYQQYLYKNNIGSNSFTHRFRLEERFFPNEFGLRGRYFISSFKTFIKYKR